MTPLKVRAFHYPHPGESGVLAHKLVRGFTKCAALQTMEQGQRLVCPWRSDTPSEMLKASDDED